MRIPNETNREQSQTMERLFSVDETMLSLRIGRTALWNLTRVGKLRGTRVGRRLYFRETELRRFLNAVTDHGEVA